MICQSCNKQKNSLKVIPSKILKGQTWLMCATCESNGYEPRFALVMAGRLLGVDAIQEYIKKEKYIGEPISLKDVIS